MKPFDLKPNPELDLILERVLDVPIDLMWKGWTQPEHLKKWFCPKPFFVTEVDIDLRPGGRFNTKMEGPNDFKQSHNGCYLEVIENKRITWTGAMSEGFRPQAPTNDGTCSDLVMTALVSFEDNGKGGTKYTVVCIHPDVAGRDKHKEMGFDLGWSAAADQLVEEIKSGGIS